MDVLLVLLDDLQLREEEVGHVERVGHVVDALGEVEHRAAEHRVGPVEQVPRQRLAAGIFAGHPFQSRPSSLHLWLSLPQAWRAEELQQQAEQVPHLSQMARDTLERLNLPRTAAPVEAAE